MVTSQSDEYIDLREIYLYVELKITKSDGTNYVAADNNKYCPINYLLNSMFSQVDITLSDTLVSQSNNIHPFRSYFEVRFCASNHAKGHILKTSGYWKDDTATPDAINSYRHLICKESKIFCLIGRIHSDIFLQNKLLLNGVPIKLKLFRSSDSFCLQAEATYSPKLKLIDTILYVKKVRLNPSILAAQARVINDHNAVYPIVRTDVKVLSVPANQNVHSWDNCYLGEYNYFGTIQLEFYKFQFLRLLFFQKYKDIEVGFPHFQPH